MPGSVMAGEPRPPLVVVVGRGAAHGMGLAMDGVLGQARAGWSYDRILDGFYVGTTPGRADGILQVGLAHAESHALELPSGGEVVLDGDRSVRVAPGTVVRVVLESGRYRVHLPELEAGAPVAQEEDPDPAPPEPPDPTLPLQPALPTPTPEPEPSEPPADEAEVPELPADASLSEAPVWIRPDGDPALVRLEATGRRYKGQMEIAARDGGLWAVNHVDLETYVMGIAEEKGQGWPVEGLKVLAVAARSLAAATMTWYTKNHANGFHICPTDACQVYLGYDGEEEAMRQATRATAGEIRTHGGRPILAMYHGNGGGQTDTHRLIYGDGVSDPFPYLTSVRYAHANPSRWRVVQPLEEVEAALVDAGLPASGLRAIEVTERGDSPRVRRLRLRTEDGELETTGLRFQGALDLRSAWFDVTVGEPDVVVASRGGRDGLPVAAAREPSGTLGGGWSWTRLLAMLGTAGLGASLTLRSGAARPDALRVVRGPGGRSSLTSIGSRMRRRGAPRDRRRHVLDDRGRHRRVGDRAARRRARG